MRFQIPLGGLQRSLFCVILLVLAGAALAESPARDHVIVPEDYLDIASITSLAVSPDGQQAVWTESRWGRGSEGRFQDLWLLDRRQSPPTTLRLTFDGFGASAPVWSADGSWIYFRGREEREGSDKPPYDGTRQVWRIRPDGGELMPVTRAAGGAGQFCLAPDGRAVYYTVDEEQHEEPWKDLKQEHGHLEYGHGVVNRQAVHRLDLSSWRAREIQPADRVIHDLALSPDGARLAMITTEDEELIFMEGWSRVDVLDLNTGEVSHATGDGWRGDHPSPYGWLENLAWSHDSEAVAFSISYDGHPTRIYVAENADGAWALQQIARPHPVDCSGGLQWQGKGRTLTYRGEAEGRVRVLAVDKAENGGHGDTRELTPGDVVVEAAAFTPDGKTLLAAFGTTERIADIYRVHKGRYEALTDLNPQVHAWQLPQIEHVTWTGGDGDPVSGILELPHDYDRATDGPLPLILEIHGGPTASTQYRLRLWIYGRAVMPANGYALLSPNYHGSTGYGDEFMEKLVGRENDIDVADLITGVQHLIDTGIADADRVGVMGWSNGGYLTNCVITAAPDMFRAASSGAGVLDQVIQWGTEDTPGHVINFVEGLPWEAPDHYRAASPLYELDKVKTPTIIHVGGQDPRVPPAHSRALYRALHHYLGVPCELIVYPGEPHGLTTAENRMAKIHWDLAWFEKYLLAEDAE